MYSVKMELVNSDKEGTFVQVETFDGTNKKVRLYREKNFSVSVDETNGAIIIPRAKKYDGEL